MPTPAWAETVNQTQPGPDGFLRTKAAIGKCEVVLQVAEASLGPGRGKLPVCLGCLGAETNKNPQHKKPLEPCGSCSWPVCSPDCSLPSSLHGPECKILQGLLCPFTDYGQPTNALDFIAPLRLLLKLKQDPKLKETFDKIKVDVEATKKRNAEIYGADKDQKIVDTIKTKLKQAEDDGSIYRAIALVERFSLPLDASRGTVGVYPQLGSIQHSCSPNTYTSPRTDGQLVLRAALPIKQGETVSICKVDNLQCNLFRRKLLSKALVDCHCPRCEDGSEYGTGFGSVVCADCNGIVSPIDSKKEGSDWKCLACNKVWPSKHCVAILEGLVTKLEEEKKIGNPPNYEKILEREGEWSGVPPGSQIFQDVRHRLINLYQYHKDFYYPQESYLKAKLAHIEEWLKLKDLLSPGLNFGWALVMYEKVSASVSLLLAMKEACKPIEETNAFISEIAKIVAEPVEMLKEEEDPSLLNVIRQSGQVAVEAREEQKKRILINQWDDDDDDWTGYT